MHFKMSSAICFNLDQSTILPSSNGLEDDKILAVYKLKLLVDKNFIVVQIIQTGESIVCIV